MHRAETASATIVPFRPAGPRAVTRPRLDPRALLDSVYAAGSLPVPAEDGETKSAVAQLQLFGFVVVEEVSPDGRLRRLKSSETVRISLDRPWRVSKLSSGAGRSVALAGPRPGAAAL